MLLNNDIGIDLGTSSVLVYCKNKGIVAQEPSVVTVDENTKEIVAIGEQARKMLGKTPTNIVAVRPLREGVVSNFEVTEKMIRYFIDKAIGTDWFKKPTVAVCVPSRVTDTEKMAVEQATKYAGAGRVHVIEEPVAAALGAGIDITKPCGSLVVDIGGGTTDIAVISLGGIVISTSVKIAGDNFNDAILAYISMERDILIGEGTAENLKVVIGTVSEKTPYAETKVSGINKNTKLPDTITVSTEEMYKAMKKTADDIVEAVIGVLENTPPELSADILERGIVLTGGGSLLEGISDLIEDRTGVKCVTADDPVKCVAIGAGKYLEYKEDEPQQPSFSIKSLFGFWE